MKSLKNVSVLCELNDSNLLAELRCNCIKVMEKSDNNEYKPDLANPYLDEYHALCIVKLYPKSFYLITSEGFINNCESPRAKHVIKARMNQLGKYLNLEVPNYED